MVSRRITKSMLPPHFERHTCKDYLAGNAINSKCKSLKLTSSTIDTDHRISFRFTETQKWLAKQIAKKGSTIGGTHSIGKHVRSMDGLLQFSQALNGVRSHGRGHRGSSGELHSGYDRRSSVAESCVRQIHLWQDKDQRKQKQFRDE